MENPKCHLFLDKLNNHWSDVHDVNSFFSFLNPGFRAKVTDTGRIAVEFLHEREYTGRSTCYLQNVYSHFVSSMLCGRGFDVEN